MGILAIPYDFLDHHAQGITLLFHGHGVNLAVEGIQNILQNFKLIISQSMTGSKCFHISQSLFQCLAFFMQFINLLDYIFFRGRSGKFGQSSNQSTDFRFVLCNLFF